jgi:hypothetical protein
MPGAIQAPSSADCLPDSQLRDNITAKLADLIKTIEAHPSWIPPQPHKGLYHVWDFANRTWYIMTELDNIRDGRPLRYPEQIPRQEAGNNNPPLLSQSTPPFALLLLSMVELRTERGTRPTWLLM